MKIDRLITILMMLINRKKVTAKELSEYFEVSVRTIQRDMDTLLLSGVPLYADVGKNGGYQLIEDYKLNNNFLNIDEGKLLLSLLASLDDTIPSTEVKSIYNKLVSVVPKDESQKLVVKLNPSTDYGELKNHLQILTQARDNHQKVHICYVDANLNKSERILSPHTLVMVGIIWYVFGYCDLRNDFRLFKISRIDSCEILSEKFERKELPEDLPWNKIFDSHRESTPVELLVDISQKDRLPDYFSYKDCEIIGDKIRIKVNFPVDDWLYSIFAGLIPHVKIVSPDWVREEFVKRLKLSIEKNIL